VFFRFLIDGIKISTKQSIAITALTSSSMALFFLIPWIGVDKILFYGFAALSAIVGSLLSERTGYRKLISIWIVFGVVNILFLPIAHGTLFLPFLSSLLGISLGFGLSSCFALMAENTLVEERTRISALIILELFLIVPLVMFVAETFHFGLTERVLLVAFTRFTCFLPFAIIPLRSENKGKKAILSSITQKNFILYLFPWIFFNIAAGLNFWWTRPQITSSYNLDPSLATFYLCTAVFGIISGIASDRFGRRLPIGIGIAMGGISFAILGYSFSFLTYLISVSILGVAWGFLLAVYLAIPGDIAGSYTKEKFYALGTITPLILYLGINAVPSAQFDFDMARLFPIISILLFLAIVPILIAKETLPENKIYDRKIKEHMVELGKLLEESKEKI
jgi:MFS family permease